MLLDDTIKSALESMLLGENKNSPFNNYFIYPVDTLNPDHLNTYQKISCALKSTFEEVTEFDLCIENCGLKTGSLSPSIILKCIKLSSRKIHLIRDTLKEVLWGKPPNPITIPGSLPGLDERVNTPAGSTVNPSSCKQDQGLGEGWMGYFKLENYGYFIPYRKDAHSDLITHCFVHNTYYRYRLNNREQCSLPQAMKCYLQLLINDCPNHLFINNQFRASGLYYDFCFNIKHETNHELISLAKESLGFRQYKSGHENLQKYFLENDPYTIASEVPVWIESHELQDYSEKFGTSSTLTGHIDLLRCNSDYKIEVWDYKPRALREKKAHIQVFLYAFMLSVRTGIMLENFICGYFDDKDLFIFDPSKIKSKHWGIGSP